MDRGPLSFEWVFDSEHGVDANPVVDVPMGDGHFRFETIESTMGVRAILADGMTGRHPVDFHAADGKDDHELCLLIPTDSSFQATIPGVPNRRPITHGHCTWHLPAERWTDYHLPAENRIRTVGMMLAPELVDRVSEGRNLPNAIRAIERQGSPSPFEFRGMLGSDASLALQQLFNAPYRGEIRRMFMESKVLELVAHAFDNLLDRPRKKTRLSSWEVSRVREAAERIMQRPATPPDTQELARAVGLPSTRLMAVFREYYGTTPVRWLQRRKLEMAHQLLLEEPITIKTLAYRLGYRHVSNFTNAFRRQFGYPPGALRKKM